MKSRRKSDRSEEHTSELQSPCNLVCRLLLEKKNTRLNSSHLVISYAVFCLKKKKKNLFSSLLLTVSSLDTDYHPPYASPPHPTLHLSLLFYFLCVFPLLIFFLLMVV